MSRFFAKPGESSSEESTEEETSSEEESSSEDERPQQKKGAFAKDEPSRSSGPRKLMSQKDKRYDDMRMTVKQLKNAMTINDWNAIVTEFQKINQQLAKAQTLGEPVPTFYIKIISQLADLIEETHKDKEGQEDVQDQCQVSERHASEYQEEQCGLRRADRKVLGEP
jgi:translation initiation factor 3 subunit C